MGPGSRGDTRGAAKGQRPFGRPARGLSHAPHAAVAAGTPARGAAVQPICPTVSQTLQTGAQAAWSVPQWAQRQRGSGRAAAAFAAAQPVARHEGDKAAFLGRAGDWARPEALAADARWLELTGRHFDLEAYVLARLSQAGLRDVAAVGIDTYAHADRFFSYRRSTHRGESDYGRQISMIAVTS